MYDERYRPNVARRGDASRAGSSPMSDAHASSSSSLSRFVSERSLPSVVQVLAGCYGNIGVNKDNELYVHSASDQTVVVAETLAGRTMTTGRSIRRLRTSTGQTLSLPLDYDGWFELMSVDRRTAPVLNSVRQLVDVFPTRCLVRKIINVMTIDDVCRGDGTRSRRLYRGDVLTLVRVTGQRLLQCRDDKGRGVYLPLNQRGLFSAVDGRTAASVYALRSLIAEFRLPIVVRLVCGSLPTRDATARDLRLVGIQTDRVTFVLPLRHVWTSKSVDGRALVAVPSRYASRLTVAAAARDFYSQWARSDDGAELARRCGEIVASWKTGVHVVSGAVAVAAAAAAAASRGDDGDDATWSRGPMGSSVDSGLASSTSSPCFPSAWNAHDDDDDDVEHLEREIDDIYAAIRYGADAVARRRRARSLDDCLSGGGGDVLSQRPMMAVYGGRRPSVDALRVAQTRRRRLPGIAAAARQRSCELHAAVDDVQLVGVTLRLDAEMDDDDDDDDIALDRDWQETASNSGRVTDPYAAAPIYDELTTHHAQRPRSKSLPEVTAMNAAPRDGKSQKSFIGTFTRSIANAFRRFRPRRASHTFAFERNMKAFSSERYTRRTDDCNGATVDT